MVGDRWRHRAAADGQDRKLDLHPRNSEDPVACDAAQQQDQRTRRHPHVHQDHLRERSLPGAVPPLVREGVDQELDVLSLQDEAVDAERQEEAGQAAGGDGTAAGASTSAVQLDGSVAEERLLPDDREDRREVQHERDHLRVVHAELRLQESVRGGRLRLLDDRSDGADRARPKCRELLPRGARVPVAQQEEHAGERNRQGEGAVGCDLQASQDVAGDAASVLGRPIPLPDPPGREHSIFITLQPVDARQVHAQRIHCGVAESAGAGAAFDHRHSSRLGSRNKSADWNPAGRRRHQELVWKSFRASGDQKQLGGRPRLLRPQHHSDQTSRLPQVRRCPHCTFIQLSFMFLGLILTISIH